MGSRMSKSKRKPVEDSKAQSNIAIPQNQQPVRSYQADNMSSVRSAGARNKIPTRKPENYGKDARRATQEQRSTGGTVRNAGPAGLAGRDRGPEKSQIDRAERKRVHKKDDESGKTAQFPSRFANQHGGFPQEEQTFEQSVVRNSVRVDDEQSTQQRPFPDNVQVVEREISNALANEPNSVARIVQGVPLKDIMNKCNRSRATADKIDVRDKPTIGQAKIPVEDAYVDRWDDSHVQMPCSSMYMAENQEPRWPAVYNAFRALKKKCEETISTFDDLKTVIETYGDCPDNMAQLEKLINKVYTDAERSTFLHQTLPKMCDLVLNLRSMFKEPPLLLRIGSNQTVTLSQEQAASFLTCAFFCLFPYRSETSKQKSFERFPHPNFDRLYQGDSAEKIEKLKCLLHYFQRVCNTMPTGQISFRRFQLSKDQSPSWTTSSKALCQIDLRANDRIEDMENYLQVDFANKYIGGGVLGNGCVQEEIRFTICPEMIVSLLLCEVMEPDECIFLIGCERYSTYTGYAKSFQFAGDFEDKTVRDQLGQRCCHVVAMDAIYFREKTKQYQKKNVHRELLKAYTSFYPYGKEAGYRFPIATGNWGCGAFNGDKELKAIIQLMAASETERTLLYASFGDKSLVESFSKVYDYLQKEGATVGSLYQYLHQYWKLYNQMTLFQYILRTPVASLQS